MTRVARLLLIAVLAAFAANSVVFAAGSAKMLASIAISGHGAMNEVGAKDSPDCGVCAADEAVCASDAICAGGGPAMPTAAWAMPEAAPETLRPVARRMLVGLAGPPAKRPPRTLI